MGAGPGARGAIDNDDAADIARRAVDHEVGAALVDTTQTLVCILDRDGRIVRFNPACERVTGWTSEEVVGRDARETVIPPEDHAAFVAMIRGMVATGAPNPQQGQWVTRDGYRRVIAWANRPLRDESGEVRYVVTSGLDITERESAASELWALQAELRDRLEDLGRLAAEQAALRRVATLVAAEAPQQEVLDAVVHEVAELLRTDTAGLLRLDGDQVTIVSGKSSDEDAPVPVGLTAHIDRFSATKDALLGGRPARSDAARLGSDERTPELRRLAHATSPNTCRISQASCAIRRSR